MESEASRFADAAAGETAEGCGGAAVLGALGVVGQGAGGVEGELELVAGLAVVGEALLAFADGVDELLGFDGGLDLGALQPVGEEEGVDGAGWGVRIEQSSQKRSVVWGGRRVSG